MKNFFNIETAYRFEWNDLRALTMILNVIFVMIFGFSASWFGLAIAVVGIIKDLTNPQRHCNDILMHVAGVVLNCYFLSLMYRG
jgi:hypothetical protein